MNWYHHALLEIESFFDVSESIHPEEKNKRTVSAVKSFHDLFISITKKKRIRDKWSKAYAEINDYESGAKEVSDKTGTEITIGVGLYGYFIRGYIAHPEHIQSMSDEFWKQILGISQLGKCELLEYGRPESWINNKRIKELSQFKNSLVYQLSRDYVLLNLENDFDSGIGAIEVLIPHESKEEEILKFFSEGVSYFYKTNYLLYRSHYIAMKRHEKEFEKKHGQKINLI